MKNKRNLAAIEIYKNLEQTLTLSYIKSDIAEYIRFYEQRIINHIVAQISNQYSSNTANENIPSSHFWDIATLKAYDIALPLLKEWLAEMRQTQTRLKEKI